MYRHSHSRLFAFFRLKERQINIGRIDLRPGETTCYPLGRHFLSSHRALYAYLLSKLFLFYRTIQSSNKARLEISNSNYRSLFYIQLIFKLFLFNLVSLFTVKFICGTAGMAASHFDPIYRLFLGMVLPTEIHAENYLNVTILSEFFVSYLDSNASI